MEQNQSESPHSADGGAGPSPLLPATLSPLSFDPVPVRPRHDGLTPQRQRGFIEGLTEGLSVAAAARAVGVSEASVYRLRGRADAAGFAAAWDAALADRLRQAIGMAFDRVLTGTVKRTFYHGELVNEEVVHSERLLLWMLEKGHTLLGDHKGRAKVAADWDAALDRLESGEADGAAGYRVWQDHRRLWLTNFPPPEGFDGFEHDAPGSPDYHRTLTTAEKRANDARQRRLGQRAAAARDAFFAAPPRAERARKRR